MGGSSIVAAAAIQCTRRLFGLPVASRRSLVSLVSALEQILGSGGGWQDQVPAVSVYLIILQAECTVRYSNIMLAQ